MPTTTTNPSLSHLYGYGGGNYPAYSPSSYTIERTLGETEPCPPTMPNVDERDSRIARLESIATDLSSTVIELRAEVDNLKLALKRAIGQANGQRHVDYWEES